MKDRAKFGQTIKTGTTSYKKQIGKLGTVGKNIELQRQQEYRQSVKQYKSDLAREIGADKIIDNRKGFTLVKGFQQYKFSDTGQGVQYQGAELFVPKGYERVNNKLVAKPQEFVKSSRQTGQGRVSQKGTYSPKEIILDEQGNITQVIERKVYKKSQRSGKREKEEYDVYVSKKQYFSNGQLVGEETYSPYQQTYKKDGGRKQVVQSVYKQSETVYEPSGKLSKQLVYSPYAISKRRSDKGRREQYGVYLASYADVDRGEQLRFRKPETQKRRDDLNTFTPPTSKSNVRDLTPEELSQNQSRLPRAKPQSTRFVRGLFGLK